ncbi:MAG: Clp protease N-terminal domain-containing protein [Planctomycetota bacterium]
MIKELSERAKEAIDNSRQLAKELSDSCVATGHLIYGLTLDHLSLGNRIFNDVNIYPEMFRDHLKKMPREVTGGDKNGFHPLVVLALVRGRQARQKLGGGRQTSTDHVLIGLLSVQEGSAFECMREFSVSPGEIQRELIEAMGFEVTDCPTW